MIGVREHAAYDTRCITNQRRIDTFRDAAEGLFRPPLADREKLRSVSTLLTFRSLPLHCWQASSASHHIALPPLR